MHTADLRLYIMWRALNLLSHGQSKTVATLRSNFQENKAPYNWRFKSPQLSNSSSSQKLPGWMQKDMDIPFLQIPLQLQPEWDQVPRNHSTLSLRPDDNPSSQIQILAVHETNYRTIRYMMKLQLEKYIVGNRNNINTSRKFLLQILPQRYLIRKHLTVKVNSPSAILRHQHRFKIHPNAKPHERTTTSRCQTKNIGRINQKSIEQNHQLR